MSSLSDIVLLWFSSTRDALLSDTTVSAKKIAPLLELDAVFCRSAVKLFIGAFLRFLHRKKGKGPLFALKQSICQLK
jgi:hypothetical protein